VPVFFHGDGVGTGDLGAFSFLCIRDVQPFAIAGRVAFIFMKYGRQ